MPRAPKACARQGCPAKVTGRTYCPEHQPIGWKSGGASRTSTPEHRAWRRAVLDRDGWRCQIRGPRCTGRATQADHITPVTRGGAEFDIGNGQAVCGPCHATKTQREAAEGRRRAAGG